MTAKPPSFKLPITHVIWPLALLLGPSIPRAYAWLLSDRDDGTSDAKIGLGLEGIIVWAVIMFVLSYAAGMAEHRRLLEFGEKPKADRGTMGCAFAVIGTFISLFIGFLACSFIPWLSR